MTDPMLTIPLTVSEKRRDLADTVTLTVDTNGHFPEFTPGQFNMLYAFGVGEVPISISGDSDARTNSLVHTVRSVGAVTQALCALDEGDTVGVRGPYGNTWPVEKAEGEDVLIVAGGLGLAPLRPAILRILTNRERYGRVTLLYGARTPEEILYAKQLQNWRGRFDVEVEVTVDRATLGWRGNVGVVVPLITRVTIDPEDTIAFVCGPEIMMRFSALELTNAGIPADRMYVSMERNMKCGVGLCGHCQLGPYFICKDGPVFSYDRVSTFMSMGEV